MFFSLLTSRIDWCFVKCCARHAHAVLVNSTEHENGQSHAPQPHSLVLLYASGGMNEACLLQRKRSEDQHSYAISGWMNFATDQIVDYENLIAMTMLVVDLFAARSWELTFYGGPYPVSEQKKIVHSSSPLIARRRLTFRDHMRHGEH
jgi:hypothetical protein